MAMFLDLPRVSLPGPRTLPLIGGKLSVFAFLSDPVARMLELHQEYGDLAALSRDNPGWISVAGSQLVHRVLSDPALFPNFLESPIPFSPDSAAGTMNINILAQNGDTHRRTRRVLMAAFTKERLRGYADQMLDLTARRIATWPLPGTLAARSEMTALSLEIAMRCLFGLSLEEAAELSRASVHFMELVLNPACALFPVSLPGTPYRDFMRTAQTVEDNLRELIARRRREGGGDDVLSALIAATDEDGRHLDDRELIGHCATLINASHETTAMTLTWACLMLATHREIQVAAAEEVAATIGDSRPSLEDLERMPLLGWIIDETLRLFPATPNLFFRRASADFELAGHELPAGATLLISPLVTHRDPSVFPEPRRFLPRRWDGLKVGPYAYLPFGAGARRCIGAGFAGQATRLILALILQRVRLCIDEPTRVDYEANGVVLGLRQELHLKLATPAQGVCVPAPITGTVERMVQFAPVQPAVDPA